MKLENQVCTFEQAKKLGDLGIEGSAQLYWIFDGGMKWRVVQAGYFDPHEEGNEHLPAWSVAELGVMLPGEIGEFFFLQTTPNELTEYNYTAAYSDLSDNKPTEDNTLEYRDGDTEAESRAWLLICMLDSGKITADQVNARLAEA